MDYVQTSDFQQSLENKEGGMGNCPQFINNKAMQLTMLAPVHDR